MVCSRKGISPLPIKLAKITIVVIFFCFAECAAGSCLNYGHACWGAHGKRSSNIPLKELQPKDLPNTNWFLSRLIQSPLDLRYLRFHDVNMNGLKPGHHQHNERQQQIFNPVLSAVISDVDNESMKGQEEWTNLQEIMADDANFEDVNAHLARESDKFKFLDKRSAKMN